MQTDKESVSQVVLETARRIISTLDEGDRFEVDSESVLFGESCGFDSIGLMTFLIELEDTLETTYGRRIALADDNVLHREDVPFRTVPGLCEFIRAQLGKAGNA